MKRVILAHTQRPARSMAEQQLRSLPGIELLTTASTPQTLEKKIEGYSPDICIAGSDLALTGSLLDQTTMTVVELIDAQSESVAAGKQPTAQRAVRLPGTSGDIERFRTDLANALGVMAAEPSAPSQPASSVEGDCRTATVQARTTVQPVEAIGIGISTGGPQALAALFRALPTDFPVPILVTQHIPPNFSGGLAESLDRISALNVREGVDQQPVEAGNVYIAPGGCHMQVAGNSTMPSIRISREDPERGCRPSANIMLRSMHQVFGSRLCALVMTGMGDDGLDACRKIHAGGGFIIAQEASSCTVYGMPRSVIEEGVVDQVVELNGLASALVERTR